MSLRHAGEILESHNHMTAEVKRLLEFVQAQQDGKHGRARERGRSA
jgi:UDP-N-acetylglucosamine acyltransferase